MDNMKIAQTIMGQLGGGRFMAMTGAKELVALEAGLRFRIPLSKGVNMIEIKLNGNDLYDVRFWKTRGIDFKEVGVLFDVWAENLREVFTGRTGLETRL